MSMKLVTNQKIAETSSKGIQEKWLDTDNNCWYKADLFGYEALAEMVASSLLKKCNVTEKGFEITAYQLEKVNIHSHPRTVCSSKNFLTEGEELMTLAGLFKKGLGPDYLKDLEKQSNLQKKILFLVENTEKLTGLTRFGEYLTLLFETDMLFLNDDRHLNNIAVIRKEGQFDYCPLFDFGAGLLSNTRDYPLDILPSGLIGKVTAKPFQCNFTRQVHAAQAVFGQQLELGFQTDDIEECFKDIENYYSKRDTADIKDRIRYCLKRQSKKLSKSIL